MNPSHADILSFWFDECLPAQWWRVDPAFDASLRARFEPVHRAAALGELFGWRTTPAGRLAEIIVLDQFSRNLHRASAQAYAADPMALALAQEAVAGSHDMGLPPAQRMFMYMPFVHSESRVIHEVAAPLLHALGQPASLDSAVRHKAIIDRFGRYPHRNAVLGRASTAEELAFLRQPGSRF